MYFLAHMYNLLKALPDNLSREDVIEPMILGSWCPDAGYFPHFSRQLTIFSHTETPLINLYKEDKIKSKCFEVGWKAHIACDDQIHNEPFFENGKPLCPLIERNKGYKILLSSVRLHLGREIGLDVLIFNELDLKDKASNILLSKSTYINQKITFPGFNKIQNYVYKYVMKFLPMVSHKSSFSNTIKRMIDYKFFNQPNIKNEIDLFLKKSQEICKKIISEELTKDILKTTTKKRKDF